MIPIACYILSGSFSTSTNDRMINVFTLIKASQNESPNSRYPRNPYYSLAILYKDCSFSPGLTRVTPPFGNTTLSERLIEISHTTLMLDLRKKTIKGFRSKFQAEIFSLGEEVGLSEPQKKHPSGLVGWAHLGFCDGYLDDWGDATGGHHGEQIPIG